MKWISAAVLILASGSEGIGHGAAETQSRFFSAAPCLCGQLSAGDEAADFSGVTWVDKAPDLKGKVVLVRWWTNGCSLCSGSAPALAELGKKATVVAVYHPKPPRDVSADDVRAFAKEIGMPGVLAIDRDWKVLDRWMPPKKRAFTSLTFVLDKKGKVRRVHPGGTIEPKDADELAQQIDALLAEKE